MLKVGICVFFSVLEQNNNSKQTVYSRTNEKLMMALCLNTIVYINIKFSVRSVEVRIWLETLLSIFQVRILCGGFHVRQALNVKRKGVHI